MRRVMILALLVFCLVVSVACSSENDPALSPDAPISLKVLDLASFQEVRHGSCLVLVHGLVRQRMTIITKNDLRYEDWFLDTASSDRLSRGVLVGSCLLYNQKRYQVAPA